MATPKWTEERTNELVGMFPEGTYVSQSDVAEAAEKMETTARSISSKLRKMGYDVQLASEVVKASSFTDEQEAQLTTLLENNPGAFTYGELAEQLDGEFTAKQVQGKVLSMQLTTAVKPTPKVEAQKSFTDEQAETLIKMAKDGAFIEDIAEALGKEANSVRGKALSLLRNGELDSIPKQKNVKSAEKVDAFAELGDVSGMSVADIAEKIGKSERGVRTMLTRRGVTAADYDGAAKAAKLAEKAE